jgi:hypothetical protein
MRNDGKHLHNEKINVDKQNVVNLHDMKELANQLKLVGSSQVSEVIQQKVNTMNGKIDSFIEDIVGKKGNAQVISQNNKSKPSRDKQLKDHYAIPVITNGFEVLRDQTEIEVNDNVSSDLEHQRFYDNIRKKSHRVIILGDSHTRGIANEIHCKLGKNFEILGIVKPGAKIEEITNSLDSTVRSYTKRDVCIIWGGAWDVAKNEGKHGLRQMKKVVSNMNHTNLVIINVLHRHDLHESSCISNAI